MMDLTESVLILLHRDLNKIITKNRDLPVVTVRFSSWNPRIFEYLISDGRQLCRFITC
jgi:hypothetical protein